jgi:hypothetical protein
MPKFVTQRSLYEVRERPSKAYSWVAFVVSNIVVEIPYQIILGVLVWASYYYPIYGANQSSDKQGLMLLLVIQFFLFTSTFADLVISALPDAETAGKFRHSAILSEHWLTLNRNCCNIVLCPHSNIQRSHADSNCTSRILDLYVPCVASDILDRGIVRQCTARAAS